MHITFQKSSTNTIYNLYDITVHLADAPVLHTQPRKHEPAQGQTNLYWTTQQKHGFIFLK